MIKPDKRSKRDRTGKGIRTRSIAGVTGLERAFALAWFRLSTARGSSRVGVEAYYAASPTSRAKSHTARTEAHRLLKRPGVRAIIEELREEVASAAIMSASEVLAELSRVGRSDLRHVARWGDLPVSIGEDGHTVTIPHGVSLVSSDRLDPDISAAIAEIRQTENGIVIKLHDKIAALDKLGKYHGLFRERIEHSGMLTLEELVRQSMPSGKPKQK